MITNDYFVDCYQKVIKIENDKVIVLASAIISLCCVDPISKQATRIPEPVKVIISA